MLGSRWKGHSDAKLDALARLRFVFAGRADHACNGRDPGWVRRYLWQLADTAFVMGRMCWAILGVSPAAVMIVRPFIT